MRPLQRLSSATDGNLKHPTFFSFQRAENHAHQTVLQLHLQSPQEKDKEVQYNI
jgi:hypothetical protein